MIWVTIILLSSMLSLNTVQGEMCRCVNKPTGRVCHEVSTNCKELRSLGYTQDGVYYINPDGQCSFQVYCDMTTDGGGWTVFQRNGKDSETSFNQNWEKYKTGFGTLTGHFWLGLDKIHKLITKMQAPTLRIDLENESGTKKYAEYSSFSVANESDFYRMQESGYSGTAGDAFRPSWKYWNNNNMKFTTPDKDNDNYPGGNCATGRKGGWWYNHCTNSDLNGDVSWWTFSKAALKKTEMKLR